MERKKFFKWLTRIGIVALGAGLGFAYYHFIGCRNGACPIASNPWISTGYGALIGFLFTVGSKSQKEANERGET